MSSRIVTPGPYRATKLWNEVTRLFRAGMPVRKHRQNFRHHSSCFSASAAVDWLHQLLCSNSNFGPDVTRQQTVQLLQKFLKNRVIEDVKGRWGTEDFEDNNVLYRFPSASPLKPIPCAAPASAHSSVKKRPSFRDKESFFRFKTMKKHNRETQENVAPVLESGGDDQPIGEQFERQDLTVEDERELWRGVTLTHLQKILHVASLDEVLDQRCVNPQNIIHNMTKVNKHGVVTLEDQTDDLPFWVLSAMKSLASWPKYDTAQPSYPGFERDVFKTVSDYFYGLPQPLLTYDLYELFINVLVFSGYVAEPTAHQHGKRKKADPPSAPPPTKAFFRSTECLLLSLLRQGACDETESPMREVLVGTLQSRLGGLAGVQSGGGRSGSGAVGPLKRPTRSCSLETVLDDSARLTRQKLFLSNESLATGAHSNRIQTDIPADSASGSELLPVAPEKPPGCKTWSRLTGDSGTGPSLRQRPRHLRPRSVGSCLDIVVATKEEDAAGSKWRGRATSCLNVNSSASHPPSLTQAQGSHATTGPRPAPRPASRPAPSASRLWTRSAPSVVRRCLTSLDASKLRRPASLVRAPVCTPPGGSEHSLLQSQSEVVAIEALQLCTLLLPPASRRKLQLLMRMMSRISQNVDMPRLHPAIGTRTLMIHSFSGCVLGSAVECDLDELLATRLVSFLMDHQQRILSVPEYLLSAINVHIQYLRTVQVPIDGVSNGGDADPACAPLPIHTFCQQISGSEFENQTLAFTQKAMEELLDALLANPSISEKDRRKKLKQFQKAYPDIYRSRFPSSEQESSKPKIKPALLSIRKPKALGIRN
ncbi:DEP domain-containing protein 1A-like [Brachionichthys hirsutus]|uniref:DEP domain-containing protein 1A-like n=1 Tax=Brachionichthys hirsutus TaxID=412623 RepID=UPI00360457D3